MSQNATIAPIFKGSKGGKGAGGTARAAKEAPNTLQSNTIARVLDAVSEGEIVGLVDGMKSVYFDDTPIQNDDGTLNFSGVKITERHGLPDQEYITGFASVEEEVSVGVEVTKANPVTRTITDEDVTAVRVKIQIPALTYQDTENGDLQGSSVEFKIERKSSSGSWELAPLSLIPNPIIVSGKTTSPYEASYRVQLGDGPAPHSIRVTRITDDPSTLGAQYQSKTYWSTYTAIIDNKLSYPDTALIGVEVDAQQFSQNIPSRSYDIYGIKIKVPANYDPQARAYTGLWDGTFKVAWSDNPAWVLYDLMTSKRYGIGDSLSAPSIDKFSLYEISRYCDELVDDGYGGLEPRFTFNGVINTREEAYKVLSSISSCFRGMIYWSSGMVTATSDTPSSPVKLVSPANVIGGEFTYSGSSLKSRHSVAVIRYNDKNSGYESTLVVVEDQDMIQQMGWVTTEVAAYGCTSKGQAYRQGKWTLDNEKHSTEAVVYKASLDHADLRPGDIIAVADPSYAGARFGGRVSSLNGSDVTLDSEVYLANGETYSISIVMPDGTIETRPIVSSSGFNYRTLSFGGVALPDTPVTGAMWVISGSNAEPRQFRVISIVESEKNVFEISGLFHDPNKYARVEQNIILEDRNYSIIPSGVIRPPTSISYREYLYQVGVVLRSAVSLSWTASSDPRVSFYEVSMRRPGQDFYEGITATSSTTINIEDIPTGDYSFRVRAVDSLGNKSAYLTESKSLLGMLVEPNDVVGLKINNLGPQSSLSWTANSDLDLAYYTIKYTSALSNPQWGAGTVLVERIPKQATSVVVPTLVGSYMIKAVDSSGKESVGISYVSTNVRNINQYNVVEQLVENPSWSGTKSNVHVSGGNLKLLDAASQGIYYYSAAKDLGGVFTVRVIAAIVASGEDSSDTLDKWINLQSVKSLSSVDPSQWAVETQISTTDDDVSSSPTWSEWTTFQIGNYTARGFRFRSILTSHNANTSPNIAELSVTLDMEDRIESGEDVQTGISGESVILFNRVFKATPFVGIAAQDRAAGDYYTITSKSSQGFTVSFFNSANAGVVRTFDWIAKGYGAEEV